MYVAPFAAPLRIDVRFVLDVTGACSETFPYRHDTVSTKTH